MSDQGTPSKSSSETFLLQAGDLTNVAPAIDGLSSVSGATINGAYELAVDEQTEVLFQVDVAQSGNFEYNLAPGSPEGAVLDSSTGQFSWTPTEQQNSTQPYEIEIRVTNDGNPPLRATQTVTILVEEVNSAPVISDVQLVHDTGLVSDDNVTVDLSFTGTVENDSSVEDVTIVLDLGEDGLFDAFATVTPSVDNPEVGTFSFTFDAVDQVVFRPDANGVIEIPSIQFIAQENDLDGFLVESDPFVYSDPLFLDPLPEHNQLLYFPQLEVRGGSVTTDPIIDGTVFNPDGSSQDPVSYTHLTLPTKA